MEKEKEEAKVKSQIVQLAAVATGESKARALEELDRVRDALAAV